jgi:hypothetical protein
MAYYVDEVGNYYEGDKLSVIHTEVPERPSSIYVWNGSEWILDIEIHKQNVILELDHLFSEWFKFKRTLSPQNIRTIYWDGVDAINAGTTVEEIDTIFDNIKLELLVSP